MIDTGPRPPGSAAVAGAGPDPFASPAATTGRFLLLMIATLTGAGYVYTWMLEHLDVVGTAHTRCAVEAARIHDRVGADRLLDWYTECAAWADLRTAVSAGCLVGVLVLVTIVLYLLTPVLIRREVTPIELHDPALAEVVAAAVGRELGPGRRVSVHVDAARHVTRAFGRIGRYSLSIALRDLQGPHRDAIIAHELAHIRNRDIDLTYLTIAVWRAFVAVVVLPFIVLAGWNPVLLVTFGLRLLALLAVLFVLRVSVLRTREFYADLRVRPRPSMIAALRAFEGGKRARYHPSVADRVAMLGDSRRLFAIDVLVVGAAGALTGLAYPPAHHLAVLAWPGGGPGPDLVCGALFGGLTAAVLGATAWRAVSVGPPPRTWPATIAYAAGVFGGYLLTPQVPGAIGPVMLVTQRPGAALAAGVLLAALMQGVLRWLLHTPPGRGAGAYLWALTRTAAVTGIWVGAWFRLLDLLAADLAAGQGLVLALALLVASPAPLLALWWMGASAGRNAPSPVPAAVAGGLMLAGYWLVVLPDYALLHDAVVRTWSDPRPVMLWPVAYLLFFPAVVVSAVVAFGLGVRTGGRGVMWAVLARICWLMLPVAAGLLLCAVLHVTSAAPTGRGFLATVAGLGHLPGEDASDRAPQASLALMMLGLYAVLLLACLPAAALGCWLRRLASHRPKRPAPAPAPVPAPGRPVRAGWRRVAPVAVRAGAGAVVAAVAVLAVSEWLVPVTVADLRLAYDVTEVDRELRRPVPPMRRGEACARMLELSRSVPIAGATDSTAAGHLAAIARTAQAADDPTMQVLGKATGAALSLRELNRAAAGIGNLLRYCASAP
ncbi:M48 family metalloprotease [Dactylosporangium sp. NPDC049525]|uniref:M48 family metalloprotease n=1 Tax=Dactylosporangium sp. NPDC049525 TaxID=3154730 RepID=UPI003432E0C1